MTGRLRERQVLRLFGDVLEEAAHGAASELLVIPVLVDEFKSFSALVGEIARFAGAVWHQASEVADHLNVPSGTGIDSGLVDRVQAIAVDRLLTGVGTALQVSQAAGVLEVRIGVDPAPVNPGDRNLVGLCAALLDPSLRQKDLAFVAYDETGMSRDTQESVWSLLMDLPDLVKAGKVSNLPRALIVVIGATDVDVLRHCQPGKGVRWTFVRGTVRRRRRYESDRNEIGKLVAGDGPMVLLLGAGASFSSQLPLGDELRNDALQLQVPALARAGADFRTQASEFFRALASSGRLMPGESDMQDFIATLTLERVLREEAHQAGAGAVSPTLRAFNDRQLARLNVPGTSVKILRQLLAIRRRLVLVTVNFDQLIEHEADQLRGAAAEGGPPGPSDPARIRLFVTDDELDAFPGYLPDYVKHGGAVPLLKLHGSIEQPETVRANVDVTLPGLRGPAARALEALATRFDNKLVPWTYVGCSMRDPDITQVIGRREFAENTYERWVAPLTDPYVERYVHGVRQHAWRAASVPESLEERSISLTADDFFLELATYLSV